MGKKKVKIEIIHLDEAAWMGTLADLVFLLITFFVLLISMSSLNAKKLKEAFGLFDSAVDVLNFHEQGGGSDSFVNVVTPIANFMKDQTAKEQQDDDPAEQRRKAKKLMEEMADAIAGATPMDGMLGTLKTLAEDTGGTLKIEKIDDGFAVILPGRILFPGTRTELDEEGEALLAAIAAILKLWNGRVDVIANWSWHEGPSIVGQIVEVLESHWVKGSLIRPQVHPITRRTIRFVMRSREE